MTAEQLEIWDKDQISAARYTFVAGWNTAQQEKNSKIMERRLNQFDINNGSDINRLGMSEERPNQETPQENQSTKEELNKDEYIRIPIPRRKFLIGSGLFLGSLAAGGILSRLGIFRPLSRTAEPNVQPKESHAPQLGKESFVLGEKSDLSLKQFGLKWAPDGHISYFTTPEGKRRYFISAGVSTWMIETDGKKSLKEYRLSGQLSQEQFHEVLRPYPGDQFNKDGGYNNGYTGITGVFQIEKDRKPMHLVATTHCEQRKQRGDAGTFTASVGLAESFNGGLTWEDKGPIIRGRAPIPPGDRPSGAGQPAGIIKDGYLHIIYIEWNTGGDELYSAKMKINPDGSLGQVENIVNANGRLKVIIPAPKGTGYSALPSLSFNQDLGKYLCVFLTNQGFYEATSTDLENWSEAKKVFPFDASNNTAPIGEKLQEGQEYIYYPSYLSEQFQDDHTTGKTGELYYSSRKIGPKEEAEHNLKSVEVAIT